jgi:hemoglobin/transferrin/lactoferrin receptor protein
LSGISGNNLAGTWASGLSWQHQQWEVRAHLATGFRAPNVDDFAKFRERNGFIQVPNPDLKAEQSLSADLSIGRWINDKAKISITAYRTWLRNAIVREDFQLPNGSRFFLSRNDTLFVQANVNAEQARLWGIDLALDWKISPQFTTRAQVHHTYGRRDFALAERSIEVPLDHIPPTYGQIDILYNNGPWEASAHWRFQAQKKLADYAVTSISESNGELFFDRTGTSDNLEQTPFDENDQTYAGSYAWSVFHLRGSYRIGKQLRFRAQLNNVFDLHYRTFASGISAPGRDLVVGLYGYF